MYRDGVEHEHRIELDELTTRGLLLHVARHLHRIEEIVVATQEELEAAVAQFGTIIDGIAASVATIQTETSELGTAFTAITAELQRLNDAIAAGQQINLTSLTDLIGRAQAAADSLSTSTTGLADAANAVEGIVPPPSA